MAAGAGNLSAVMCPSSILGASINVNLMENFHGNEN